MTLSGLQEGEAFHFEGDPQRYIVTQRTPSDRSSGGTDFVCEDGTRGTKWWDDDDPPVRSLGPARLTITLLEGDPRG